MSIRDPYIGALSISTGDIARDEIVEPGIYWITSLDRSMFIFDEWVRQHSDTIKVLKAKRIESESDSYVNLMRSVIPAMWVLPPIPGETVHWVLFEVTQPTPLWPPQGELVAAGRVDPGVPTLGLPTVAERGAQTDEEDTIQAPEPEPELIDQLKAPTVELGETAKTVVWVGGGLVVAILLIGVFRK